MNKQFIAMALIALSGVFAVGAEPGTPGGLPPGEAQAKAVLEKSPRHGEWVEVAVPNGKAPLRCYIVYPERKDKAPVVMVIHEIFGESDWIRSVTDQLAADGFIAIAPDMLTGHGPNGGGTEAFPNRDAVVGAIRGLSDQEVTADLNAVREWALKLPSASGKVATIGFCWGGGKSFAYATAQPKLDAAVVYYGSPPSDEALARVNAPVLGCYGGNDNRISSTVPKVQEQMKQLNKSYEPHVYEGAGHGFLRQQDGQNGANLKAAQEAWPTTIEFLRAHTK